MIVDEQDAWIKMVRKAWILSPAIAVHMGERFKEPAVHAEITRLVKISPKAVVDVPEALQYLLGLELQRDALPAIRVSGVVFRFSVARIADKYSIIVVATSLGGCFTSHGCHIFPAKIRQPPVGSTIRYAVFGAIPCQLNLLFCTASGTSSSIRSHRLVFPFQEGLVCLY